MLAPLCCHLDVLRWRLSSFSRAIGRCLISRRHQRRIRNRYFHHYSITTPLSSAHRVVPPPSTQRSVRYTLINIGFPHFHRLCYSPSIIASRFRTPTLPPRYYYGSLAHCHSRNAGRTRNVETIYLWSSVNVFQALFWACQYQYHAHHFQYALLSRFHILAFLNTTRPPRRAGHHDCHFLIPVYFHAYILFQFASSSFYHFGCQPFWFAHYHVTPFPFSSPIRFTCPLSPLRSLFHISLPTRTICSRHVPNTSALHFGSRYHVVFRLAFAFYAHHIVFIYVSSFLINYHYYHRLHTPRPFIFRLFTFTFHLLSLFTLYAIGHFFMPIWRRPRLAWSSLFPSLRGHFAFAVLGSSAIRLYDIFIVIYLAKRSLSAIVLWLLRYISAHAGAHAVTICLLLPYAWFKDICRHFGLLYALSLALLLIISCAN